MTPSRWPARLHSARSRSRSGIQATGVPDVGVLAAARPVAVVVMTAVGTSQDPSSRRPSLCQEGVDPSAAPRSCWTLPLTGLRRAAPYNRPARKLISQYRSDMTMLRYIRISSLREVGFVTGDLACRPDRLRSFPRPCKISCTRLHVKMSVPSGLGLTARPARSLALAGRRLSRAESFSASKCPHRWDGKSL